MVSKIEFFTIYFGFFSAAFAFTVVFPFVNEMIMNFGATTDKDKTGYWAGLIASSLMLGRAIFSPIWGYILDTLGRKPSTQFGLISQSILSIAFGFGTSVIWAMITRFLMGALTPLMMSARTIIGEICKGDEMNNAMAWLTITWNIGSISGSFFGGIFSNPEAKGYISSGIFADYPYLLVNLTPAYI